MAHPSDALEALLADLRGVFADRLRSLLVYGTHTTEPIHTLAVVDQVTFEDLAACARLSTGWERRGLATPLVVGSEEFARSLDAFPLECGEILANHRVVAGSNPFDGVAVRPEDVRRACEVQAKSHLLHLREGYIESGGRPDAVAKLISASAGAFKSLVSNVARLQAPEPADARTPEALAHLAAASMGLSSDVVTTVLRLAEKPDLTPAAAPSFYPEYLRTVEQLAKFVDVWSRP